MGEVIQGKPLIAGRSSGEALVSGEPLSFWGGYNYQTGEIIDQRHPLSGLSAAGKILAVPFTRGSSSTTAVLLEAIRCMRAPAAILTTGRDPFFALASIVAMELYGRSIPVVALSMTDFGKLKTGDFVEIDENGSVCINPPNAGL